MTALLLLAALLCIFTPLPVAAQQGVDFDIATQSADRGLIEFARQAGLSVLFPTDRINQFTTHAVRGKHTVEQALGMLLDGSGLGGEFSGSGVITIKINSPGGAAVTSSSKRRWYSAITSLLTAMSSGAVLAQGASADDDVTRLEEIIVSAERRDTNLQQTPLSIVTYDQESLKAAGISSFAEMAKFTPGLSMQGLIEGNRPTFALRGIGQASGRDSAERGVGVYVDDIYVPRTTGSLLQLIDVERVEILRGPQGTLFGRNSTGGAIRYNTRKPTDTFEGSTTFKIGSFNRRDITGLVNVPFTSTFYGRFQYGSFKRDGYVTYSSGPKGGDIDDQVARATFRLVPMEGLTVDAGVTRTLTDRDRTAVVVLSNNITVSSTTAVSRYLQNAGQPALTVNDPRLLSSDYFHTPNVCYVNNNVSGFGSAAAANLGANDLRNYCNFFTKDRNTTYFLDVNWSATDALSFRSITGYSTGFSDSAQDGTGTGAFVGRDVSDFDSLSQEFQVKYTTDRFGLVTGSYYFTEHPLRSTRNVNLISTAGATQGTCCSGSLVSQDFKTNAYGLFTQANFYVTEKLQLIGGLRYSYEKKKATIYQSDRPQANATNAALGLSPGTTFNNSANWDSIVYRGSLQYQFTPDLMAYATVSTGFKAGGFNDSPQNNPLTARPDHPEIADRYVRAYDPEKIINYEIGTRSEWLDHRLRANLTAFMMKYTDIQTSSSVPQTVGTPVLVVTNAGDIDLSGAEAELVVMPVPGLTFNASLAYLHQHWTYLPDGSSMLLKTNCPSVGAITNTLANCGAQDLAGAPELQYTLGLNYQHTLASAAKLGFSTVYTHVSSKESSYGQNNTYPVPAYGLLNARVQYATDKWELAVYGTNVLNKQYLIAALDGTAFFGTVSGAPGVGREIGVELSAHF